MAAESLDGDLQIEFKVHPSSLQNTASVDGVPSIKKAERRRTLLGPILTLLDEVVIPQKSPRVAPLGAQEKVSRCHVSGTVVHSRAAGMKIAASSQGKKPLWGSLRCLRPDDPAVLQATMSEMRKVDTLTLPR